MLDTLGHVYILLGEIRPSVVIDQAICESDQLSLIDRIDTQLDAIERSISS